MLSCLTAVSFLTILCRSVVRAFAHGAMGRWINPAWWIHLFISRPASAPQLV